MNLPDATQFNIKKVLITGGAGFIGSHIADLVIEKGYDAVVVDNLSSGDIKNVNSKAKFYQGDIRDFNFLKEIFSAEKIDAVFHCAAQINVRKSVEEPVYDSNINIGGTLNLLEMCKTFGIKKFIFSSTGGAIYGDVEMPTKEEYEEMPICPYGCAKLAIEKYLNYYCKVHGINYTSLRYANVYGPRQNSRGEAGVVSIFINSLLEDKKPKIFGGKQTRDFVYVKDVARANLLALDDASSSIYNIGTGVETDINSLYAKINSFFEKTVSPKYLDKKRGEQERSCLSFEKIYNSLGWEPSVKLDDGMKETYEWIKANSFNASLA